MTTTFCCSPSIKEAGRQAGRQSSHGQAMGRRAGHGQAGSQAGGQAKKPDSCFTHFPACCTQIINRSDPCFQSLLLPALWDETRSDQGQEGGGGGGREGGGARHSRRQNVSLWADVGETGAAAAVTVAVTAAVDAAVDRWSPSSGTNQFRAELCSALK